MRVGVLALQGDFEAHAKALERAGAEPVEVRTAGELDAVCGLVIPGGESTTMLKLMEYYGLFEPLREFGRARPVFGTCAGAILIASEVLNPSQAALALVDLAIERNGYGRQLDSRVVRVKQHQLGVGSGADPRANYPPHRWRRAGNLPGCADSRGLRTAPGGNLSPRAQRRHARAPAVPLEAVLKISTRHSRRSCNARSFSCTRVKREPDLSLLSYSRGGPDRGED